MSLFHYVNTNIVSLKSNEGLGASGPRGPVPTYNQSIAWKVPWPTYPIRPCFLSVSHFIFCISCFKDAFQRILLLHKTDFHS